MNRNVRLFSVVALAAFCLMTGAAVLQSAPQGKSKKIDLNTATAAELEGLKGIGPSLAQKIIAARPFKTVAELKNVSGISQATYEAIRDQVTVRAPKPAAAAEKTPAPKPKTKTKTQETAQAPAAGLVNLNTADKTALETLPGVGSSLADKIIAARPFKSVEDLKNVSGIGDAKFNTLKDLVTVKAPRAARTTEGRAATKTTPASGTQGKPEGTPTGPVDLNTADQAALESLPGVGPALAGAIIAARPFKSVEDLKNVKGIGDVKYAGLKDLVTVGEEETAVQPKLKPGETININTASLDTLEKLLGVGPVKAQASIDGRPYAKIEDIMKVKGIKEKTFAKIKDYIVVR